jgi:hypothetical protein
MVGREGKAVHHQCGHLLWAVVVHPFDESTLVSYRDGGSMGLVVFVCPSCGKPLRLWWSVPGQRDQWFAAFGSDEVSYDT